MQTKTLPLIAVETKYNADQGADEHKPREMYLHLVQKTNGSYEPITLGTGRNAVVFLATEFGFIGQGAGFRAVKFLRDDPDDQVAYGSAMRFLLEAQSLQKKSSQIPSLVSFIGWGAIVRDLTRRGRANSVKEFWWEDHFDPTEVKEKAPISKNDGDEYQSIKNRYNLQGPFYCLELCQGTLEQLLERNQPWISLPVYNYDDGSARAIRKSASDIRSDIKKFAERYLQKDKNGTPLSLDELATMPGYDILNSFKTKPVPITGKDGRPLLDEKRAEIFHNPNAVRNYAVLQLFKRIVESVGILHDEGDGEAHRDLKPGNIFFRHFQNSPVSVEVKLGDLGYVTRSDIIEGGSTLKEGTEQAPGSPFFRAPEQAELPIEVRIDIKEHRQVSGKSSKISNIQPSDFLFVADLFEGDTSYHTAVRHLDGRDVVAEIQDWHKDHPDATQEQISDEIKARLDAFRPQLLQYLSTDHTMPDTLGQRNAYRQRRFFRVESAEIKGSGEFSLTLDQPIDRQDKNDLQAQISKSTGFQTDVYSLGAILYDLASGGRNPEHFYTYCLKVFTEQFGVNPDVIPKSIEEVMEILCPRNAKITTTIGGGPARTSFSAAIELGQRTTGEPSWSPSKKQRKPGLRYNRWRWTRFPQKPDQVDTLIEEILKSSFTDLSEENQNRWRLAWLLLKTDDEKANTLIEEILKSSFVDLPAEEVKSRWRLAWLLLTTDNVDGLIEEILRSAFVNLPEAETNKKIRDYRFRTFDVVNTLLTDKRGEKIAPEIIEIIVRCMLHDKTGSFCHSSASKSSEPQSSQPESRKRGWTAKANDILFAVDELLDTTFGHPERHFPDDLKIDLLFRLRALSFDPTATPASAASQPSGASAATNAKRDGSATRIVSGRDQDATRDDGAQTQVDADRPISPVGDPPDHHGKPIGTGE